MRIEHSIDITAPVSRLWALTLDVESWPEHTPTMTNVERLDSGPLRVGSKARVKQPGQRARVWTVTAFEAKRRFAWTTKALGTTMTGSHLLDGNGDQTTNTLVVEIEGRLAPLVGPLLRRPVAAAIAKENEGFRAAAEASHT